jgi:hypothetical protein
MRFQSDFWGRMPSFGRSRGVTKEGQFGGPLSANSERMVRNRTYTYVLYGNSSFIHGYPFLVGHFKNARSGFLIPRIVRSLKNGGSMLLPYEVKLLCDVARRCRHRRRCWEND